MSKYFPLLLTIRKLNNWQQSHWKKKKFFEKSFNIKNLTQWPPYGFTSLNSHYLFPKTIFIQHEIPDKKVTWTVQKESLHGTKTGSNLFCNCRIHIILTLINKLCISFLKFFLPPNNYMHKQWIDFYSVNACVCPLNSLFLNPIWPRNIYFLVSFGLRNL